MTCGNDRAGDDGTLGFEQDIRSLFRPSGRDSLERAVDLWSYGDVSANVALILERIEDGTIPCDGPGQAERVALLRRGIEVGVPA